MRGPQGLVEVRDDVFYVFDSDREADVFRADARRRLLLAAQLLVRRGGRMNHQRLRVADVGQVAGEFDAVDELHAGGLAALDAEADDGAGPVGQIFPGVLMPGVVRQAGVVDPLDGGMLAEPLGDGLGVSAVCGHPQVQRLQPQQEQEGAEGAHAAAHVAQQVGADVHNIGDVAHGLEGLGEDHAVIGGVRGAELRPALRVVGPGEVAGIHDGPADVQAVAPDVLGGGIHHDVDAVLDGPEQYRCGHGVVNDHRQAPGVGQFGDALKVRHIVLGVAQALQVHAARVLVGQLGDALGLSGVEEACLDVQLGKGLGEQGPGPAVEAGGGDEVLPGMGDGQYGGCDGGLAGGHGQAGGSAVQGGQALLEHIVGGVHQAGVDVPEFLQGEQIGRVFGVPKVVGGGGVDGHGPGTGGWIRLLAGMKSFGVDSSDKFVAH